MSELIVYTSKIKGISHLESNEPYQDKLKVFRNINHSNKKLAPVDIYIVCDGHGPNGHKMSKHVAEHLLNKFMENSNKYPLSESKIREIYRNLAEELRNTEYAYQSGTTAVVVILYYSNSSNEKISLQSINLGDSRAIYSKRFLGNSITADHTVDSAIEKKRLSSYKMEYEKIALYDKDIDGFRLLGILSPSRGFGDIDQTPCFTHVPDIYKLDSVEEFQFIVLASDGIWDFIDTEKVSNFLNDLFYNKIETMFTHYPKIKKKEFEKIEQNFNDPAKSLIDLALFNKSNDDISVIIIRIDN